MHMICPSMLISASTELTEFLCISCRACLGPWVRGPPCMAGFAGAVVTPLPLLTLFMLTCRVQVSEVDVFGRLLSTFCNLSSPTHLSLDGEDRPMVADCYSHRILLLGRDLQLQRVLVNKDSRVGLWKPKQLFYNEVTSGLYVVHGSSRQRESPWSDVVSEVILR